jgi:cysteine desulfurase
VSTIYLDWNATTPPHADVIEAMRRAALESWGNPASVHAVGRGARRVVEATREAIATLVGADPRDVVVTSGGTEANNLALAGVRALALTRIEHPSVTRVAESLEARGVPVEWIAVGASGVVEPERVRAALERLPEGATVALMAANHESGVIQPIGAVADVAHAAGARLHVDAVQALGKLEPGTFAMGDSLALAAHKIRGPKGIGALVWRGSPAGLVPVLRGGAQERGLRPGTVDPVLCAGFRAALGLLDAGPARYRALAELRDAIERELGQWATSNAAGSPRLPHVSSLFVRDWRGDELVAALDLAGVAVSAGSACSAGTSEPSPVLSEMLGEERARGSIRVSLGDATTSDEVASAISSMRRVLGTQSSRA